MLVRVTVPWKLWMLARVIVEVQGEPPAAIAMDKGFVERSKSGPFTVTKTTAVEVKEPDVAVTITA